jgi:hypothetical protein
LLLQHYLWREATGYLIHPEILRDLTKRSEGISTLSIADLGTGTGYVRPPKPTNFNTRDNNTNLESNRSWVFDVLKAPETKNLNITVHGFDISDDQFAPEFLWPENCKFSTSDALAEPPSQLHGQYDIVHIRLFACVRTLGDDPSAVMSHAMKLLSKMTTLELF